MTNSAAPLAVLFTASYFFSEFGPNATTFVYPAELFPGRARASGHGLCTASGKMGAFAGTYLFPTMLAAWGVSGAELAAAGAAGVGLVTTIALLPETKALTLEELAATGEVQLS